MRRRKTAETISIAGPGVPCPQCGHPTQIREHRDITDELLAKPYFYHRWFYCTNPRCVVTVHLDDRYKVKNEQ